MARGWLTLVWLVAACAPEPLPVPAAILPARLRVDVGLPSATDVVRAPDGMRLAASAWVRLRVDGTWDVPTPEPDATCAVVWTLPDVVWSTGQVVLAGLPTAGARPRAARLALTGDGLGDCPLVDGVSPGELLGGVVSVGLGEGSFARWQDALADLPDEIPRPDTTDWAWLPPDHLLDVTLALGEPPRDPREGVGVGLTVDDASRLSPGPEVYETASAADVLAGAPVLVRGQGIDAWVPAY